MCVTHDIGGDGWRTSRRGAGLGGDEHVLSGDTHLGLGSALGSTLLRDADDLLLELVLDCLGDDQGSSSAQKPATVGELEAVDVDRRLARHDDVHDGLRAAARQVGLDCSIDLVRLVLQRVDRQLVARDDLLGEVHRNCFSGQVNPSLRVWLVGPFQALYIAHKKPQPTTIHYYSVKEKREQIALPYRQIIPYFLTKSRLQRTV